MKAIAEKKSEKFDFNRIQTNVAPRFKLHGHFFHQLGHKATSGAGQLNYAGSSFHKGISNSERDKKNLTTF